MDIKEQFREIILKHGDCRIAQALGLQPTQYTEPIECVELLLELPDIKEALSLLELKRQGKLVKLADNQKLPPMVHKKESCITHYYECIGVEKRTRSYIVKAGFKRVDNL